MLPQQELTNSGLNRPDVNHFFHEGSSTLTYVVTCTDTGHCAIIDPVLDFDYASGSLTTTSADALIEHIRSRALTVDLILETHVHADHLTAAPYLQQHLGGQIGIGEMINTIQSTFAEIFDESEDFPVDGSQFDLRFADGDTFQVGGLVGTVLHVPGHTPACMAYLVGDALFVGDTLFMPDGGTARCDFPAGTRVPSSTQYSACWPSPTILGCLFAMTTSPTGAPWPSKAMSGTRKPTIFMSMTASRRRNLSPCAKPGMPNSVCPT